MMFSISHFYSPLGWFAKLLLVSALLTTLSACNHEEENLKKLQDRPVEELYNEAFNHLEAKQYKSAVEKFGMVERDHPYSKWSTKAQVMEAYAFYLDGKFDDALDTIDRFLKLHPGHKDVPYMHYLRSLCYYEQISDVKRDQDTTERALQSLKELVARFPDSTYARDAKIKIDLVQDHLAGKELEIGRYYQHQGKLVAAINRFRTVAEKYQTTTHVPEALYRLTACYYALGVTEEAKRNAAVLGYNYPNSKWYGYAYALLKGQKNEEVSQEDATWFSKEWQRLKSALK